MSAPRTGAVAAAATAAVLGVGGARVLLRAGSEVGDQALRHADDIARLGDDAVAAGGEAARAGGAPAKASPVGAPDAPAVSLDAADAVDLLQIGLDLSDLDDRSADRPAEPLRLVASAAGSVTVEIEADGRRTLVVQSGPAMSGHELPGGGTYDVPARSGDTLILVKVGLAGFEPVAKAVVVP